MKGTNSMYDIIIIGSGPAGLSAAIYAKRANLNVAVAEKEYEGTGQIAEMCIRDRENILIASTTSSLFTNVSAMNLRK